jgi:tetratricopeptide (TPR) repeat protein
MKLKHLNISKQKQGRNDLNLRMPCIKYTLQFIVCSVLLQATACKNKNSQSDPAPSQVEINPAYKNLNDSIHQFASDASLYLRRAIRLTQENKHELANEDFQKSWSLQPLLNNALPFAANLEILGKHRERLDLLESLNQRFPNNAQVGRLLADAYSAYGKPDRALIIYNELIVKDSLDPETLYEKAILLEQLKDTVQAIAALKKAYSFQGVDTYGLELAHLYAEQRNPLALEICNYILKQDSAHVLIDPLFIKGIYYSNVKQFPKAIAQFDFCILRDWKTTDAYLEKGRAYFQMGNFNAAMQTFTMAITVTNTDPDAYYWLARSYEAQNRKLDAISNYRKAISLDRNFTEARERMDELDRGFAHPSH